MARKIAEILGLNPGIQPFYAACCFDKLSRGSILCLLNASFKTAVSQRHNSICRAKIDDHGVRQQLWQRPATKTMVRARHCVVVNDGDWFDDNDHDEDG
jgi:hypothetical protein